MTIEYKVEEQDFLDLHLFNASKSERINKKKRNGWILLTVGSIVLAIYFNINQQILLTVYFGLTGTVFALFYPTYFKWRYKNHYKTQIKEIFSNRFGQIETITINNDSIHTMDKTGESKINLTEIESVNETNNHFFLKISTGLWLIIPKDQLNNADELKMKFKDLGLTLTEHINWNW